MKYKIFKDGSFYYVCHKGFMFFWYESTKIKFETIKEAVNWIKKTTLEKIEINTCIDLSDSNDPS